MTALTVAAKPPFYMRSKATTEKPPPHSSLSATFWILTESVWFSNEILHFAGVDLKRV
jgi:hypothetical protein